MRKALLVAVYAGAFGLAGCSAQPSDSADHAGSSAKQGVSAAQIAHAAQIEQYLSSGNYQQAADAAKAAVDADPENAELLLLLSRAQARLQNIDEPVKTLEDAFDAGFHDPGSAIDNPDFDRIRTEASFADLARKYGAGRSASTFSSRSGSLNHPIWHHDL